MITLGTWSSPKVSGTRPPPCSAFSFTMIDDHHAVLFGGVQFDGGKKWTNDTYILDLKIMVSTCILTLLLYYTRSVQSSHSKQLQFHCMFK